MIKRWIAGMLALVLAASLSLAAPVFAAEEDAKETTTQSQQEQTQNTQDTTGKEGEAENQDGLQIQATSAFLMDIASGDVLYEMNAQEQLPPASITKIMTMLLTMEAIDRGEIHYDDVVTVSKNAASMEGSRVYLSEGEEITVDELLKSIAVASGNDAAVAMAEYVGGTQEEFVEQMNKRAQELGMANTHFVNACGLDTDGHYSCAEDIAKMAAELMKHEDIYKYTTIWTDSIRDGTFDLANTNRLIHDYEGATGLKTGTTTKAKNCLCGTAKRDNVHLVAVVLGAETTELRFSQTEKLLDYGFDNFELLENLGTDQQLSDVKVLRGQQDTVKAAAQPGFSKMVPAGKSGEVKTEVTLAEDVQAPVEKGQKLGEMTFSLEGEELGKVDIVAQESVAKMNFGDAFQKLLGLFLRWE